MKKNLALKSIPLIIRTSIILILSSTGFLAILVHYRFNYAEIDTVIRYFLFAFTIISVMLIAQLIIIICLPKVIMMYDNESIYINRINRKEIIIKFDEIVKVHTTISILAKPFLVYTSLVITTNDKAFIVRNIDKMADVRDMISHFAFERTE